MDGTAACATAQASESRKGGWCAGFVFGRRDTLNSRRVRPIVGKFAEFQLDRGGGFRFVPRVVFGPLICCETSGELLSAAWPWPGAGKRPESRMRRPALYPANS